MTAARGPRRTASAAAWLLASVACGASGGAACDAAVGGDYPGEPRHRVEVTLGREGGADVAFALRWLGAGGVTRPAPIVGGSARRFALAVYELPPESAFRDGAEGSFAVAQILAWADRDHDGVRDVHEADLGHGGVTLAFSRDGARGAPLVDPVPPGFSALAASAPCDTTDARWFSMDAEAPSVLDSERVRMDDPGCLADAASYDLVEGCRLTPTRWSCRQSDAPPAWCGRCELFVFPEGATPPECDAWRTMCTELLRFPELDCEIEWRVCRDPGPPRVAPCDRACTCDKYEAACVADHQDAEACAIKAEACRQGDPPPPP